MKLIIDDCTVTDAEDGYSFTIAGRMVKEVDPPIEPPEPPVKPPEPPEPTIGVVFSHNFDTDNLGVYTMDDLAKYWGTSSAGLSFKEGTTSIIEMDGGQAMAVSFREGGIQYFRGVGCCSGTQWKTPLPASDSYYLAYDVIFEEGFEFGQGGKLPGLFGGEYIGGGNTPNGYTGWSGRLMWHEGGTLTLYIYHAGMPGKFGHKFYWEQDGERLTVEPGRRYRLEIRYVMNTPGEADGVIQAWLDGEPVLNTGPEFLFRKTDKFSIDGLIVTTYFGGDWASPQDQSVYFDDFVVSTAPITH